MGMILHELGRVTYVTATTVGTAQTLYEMVASLDACVTHVIMHNTDTSAIVVTLCTVPDTGGSADTPDINDEYWQQSIPASGTRVADIPIYLRDTGDKVVIYAASATKINAYVMGFTMPTQS